MVDFVIGAPFDLGNQKTTRILSWPDGSCRSASKPEIELWDEIARLQEQVETLTAQLADMTSRYNKACVDIDAKDYHAEAAEAERDRLREALRNLAHEMSFLLRFNPDKDGGLYRQRLDEAEGALKGNCQHNCNEGGICLASLSGHPDSCPAALQKEPQP